MLLDNYITDAEQEIIQKEYCGQIVNFNDFRRNVRTWYEEFDFEYPHSSENNYRDSWFHYRKMYQEHSAYEVTCQIATFEEHLQRAEKDAIVYFWQKICELLEIWYFMNAREDDIVLSADDKKAALASYDNASNGCNYSWVYLLKKRHSDNRFNFANACVYVAKHRIVTSQFRRDVQQVLHQIKNEVLGIRIGGTDIQRLNQPGEYIKLCEECYTNLQNLCRKYPIKELICMTEMIEMQLLNRIPFYSKD